MLFREGMEFPPKDWIREKMQEHNAWYIGDESLLIDYYAIQRPTSTTRLSISGIDACRNMFWARQRNNNSHIPMHIPLASDISSTCADLLFGDTPEFKIAEAHKEGASKSSIESQEVLDKMLSDMGFYSKLLEAAECASAIGGVYIKVAWDEEISEYPIPVIEQADNAYPEFTFGRLTAVSFVKVVRIESDNTGAIWRLIERYDKTGTIQYTLYKGTASNLGKMYDVNAIEETANIQDTDSGTGMLLCAYVPNMLPNRLDRNSYQGRSDYAGLESIFHSLDETYSSWMRDIYLAKGRILAPKDYLRRTENGSKFELDRLVYEQLDVDPTMQGSVLTNIQFEIRSEQYYKTCLELITRAITAAGYSTQTFGINVEGKAESGTALNIRERKSFNTKVKKEQYWEPALRHLLQALVKVYVTQLHGKFDAELEIITEFSDGANNTLSEMAASLQALANAQAISVEQKVRYLHKDWSEEQIQAETQKILDETGIGAPMENPDTFTNTPEEDPEEDVEEAEEDKEKDTEDTEGDE